MRSPFSLSVRGILSGNATAFLLKSYRLLTLMGYPMQMRAARSQAARLGNTCFEGITA